MILPSGVVSADNTNVNIANMSGSPSQNTAIKYGAASFTVKSNSWSPSLQTCSYKAYSQAFPGNQVDAGVIAELHVLAACTFTITTAGSHHIYVDYDVDVWHHTYFSDPNGPGQIFSDMYLELRNSAGVRVIQDWDTIIQHQVNTNNPVHYVMSPTHTVTTNLATGTYTLYVGIYTSLNAWSYGAPDYAMAWSQGSWSVEGISITT